MMGLVLVQKNQEQSKRASRHISYLIKNIIDSPEVSNALPKKRSLVPLGCDLLNASLKFFYKQIQNNNIITRMRSNFREM